MLVEIGHGDISALAREQHCNCASDARVGAGDQRHLVQELLRTLIVGRVVHGRELEIGLVARFFQMLLWQRRFGIDPRARLHRAAFTFLLLA